MTLAVPLALMTAGLPQIVADAPLAGGVNVTRPPATGSIGLLAVTVTTSGAGNTPPGCLAASRGDGDGEPARLEGADVHRAVDDAANPRWSVVTPLGMSALLPASMAGLPGKRAMVWVGPP